MAKFFITLIFFVFSFAVGQRFAGWTVVSEIDPITDQKYTGAILLSNERTARFAVRCVGERLDVYLADIFFNLEDQLEYIARFDKGLPREGWLISSLNRQAVLVPTTDNNWFLSRLKISQQLVVRIYDRRGQPYTYTFNLLGFNRAASLLTCIPK